MKKRRFYPAIVILILSMLFFILLDVVSVSANFVCGEVSDEEQFSSAWFDALVSYSEKPEFSTGCQISPEGNRYCCDPQDIREVPWSVGKEVTARIFDESGFVAGPVSTTISGEGFDVFPEMKLEKAIKINSPETRIFVNASNLFLNVSTASQFDKISYLLKIGNETVGEREICSNCNDAFEEISLPFLGNYELNVFAESEFGKIAEKLFLSNVEFLEFERSFSCDGCEDNFVREDRIVNMSVSFKTSHEIKGRFSDVFPNDWTIILGKLEDADLDSDGKIGPSDLLIILSELGKECSADCFSDLNSDGKVGREDLVILLSQWNNPENPKGVDEEVFVNSQLPIIEKESETHDRISWEVKGSEVKKSYLIIPPEVFLPERKVFYSEFENLKSEESILIVYDFLKSGIFSLPSSLSEEEPEKLFLKRYNKISPENALVLKANDEVLSEIAIFPKSEIKNKEAFVASSKVEFSDAETFELNSDVNSKDIDRVLIRFKVPRNSKGVGFFYFDENEEWKKLKAEKYGGDGDYFYYESFAENKGNFAIKTERGGIVNLLRRIFTNG